MQTALFENQLVLAVGALLGRCGTVGNVALERSLNTILPGIDVIGAKLER